MKQAPKRLDSLFSVAYNCHGKLCLFVWLAGCLFICLFVWLVGWLVGWLAGCLFVVVVGCGSGGGGGGGAAAAAAAEREVVFSTCVATGRTEDRGDLSRAEHKRLVTVSLMAYYLLSLAGTSGAKTKMFVV